MPNASPTMELFPTLSLGDSRAKTSPLVGKGQVWKVRDRDSGQKSSAWLAKLIQGSSLWRMSQTCLLALLNNQADGLGEFSQTWPKSGMMQSGTAYALPQWVPSTTEIGSGLLPTPLASDGVALAQFSIKSQLKAERSGHQKRPFGTLAANGMGISEICQTYEKMMGFPLQHTDLNLLEIPSASLSLPKSAKQSSMGSPNLLAKLTDMETQSSPKSLKSSVGQF